MWTYFSFWHCCFFSAKPLGQSRRHKWSKDPISIHLQIRAENSLSSKCPSHAASAEGMCSFVCSHLMQTCQSRTALCIGPNSCCDLISAVPLLQVEDLKRVNNKRPVMARVNTVDNWFCWACRIIHRAEKGINTFSRTQCKLGLILSLLFLHQDDIADFN